MIALSVSDVLLAALSASALIFGFVLQWRREDRLATLRVDHDALAHRVMLLEDWRDRIGRAQ